MDDDARQLHVLVIDHTPAMQDVLQRVLADAGYRVSLSDTLLPKQQLLAIAPDVMVLEANTAGPHGTGWQYLTMMRRDRDVTGIPLVLCTSARQAMQDPAMVRSLQRLGIQVLLKPFAPEALLAMVASAHAASSAYGSSLIENET